MASEITPVKLPTQGSIHSSKLESWRTNINYVTVDVSYTVV